MNTRIAASAAVLALTIGSGYVSTPILAQAKTAKPAPQKIDDEYTRHIKESLQDPRITTELVDHLPASDTVPSPLKFLGRYVGQPGELTYAKDIYRYYEALAKAAPARAKYWKVGTTEEGPLWHEPARRQGHGAPASPQQVDIPGESGDFRLGRQQTMLTRRWIVALVPVERALAACLHDGASSHARPRFHYSHRHRGC